MNTLMNNKLPEIIDLFSGCGGLALGFQSAGFQVTHGIELSQEAVETVSYNLHWRYGEESGHICGDITQIDLPKHQKSGLIHVGKVLKDIKGIDFIYMDNGDVVRHQLVTKIIQRFEQWEEAKQQEKQEKQELDN